MPEHTDVLDNEIRLQFEFLEFQVFQFVSYTNT